jgi:predicted unusual protein kinase regulating ubiquinone biosynthesis (AarF/ABC1/UbiB family)
LTPFLRHVAVAPFSLASVRADFEDDYNFQRQNVDENDMDALHRMMELGSIVTHGILAPVLASLWKQGYPVSADEFFARTSWDRRTNLNMTNAQRISASIEKMGPTYVKFGQALSSRGRDIVPPILADALSKLQDSMEITFNTTTAKSIIQSELEKKGVDPECMQELVSNLSLQPVASASIGQVYKSKLHDQDVAVKIQRPKIRDIVERDAILLRKVAHWIEGLNNGKLVATKLVDAIEEFMSRVTEELDFENEANNMLRFANLYSHRRGTCDNVKVVVPEVYMDYCTDHMLVMEWIEGTKLTDVEEDADSFAENLKVLESGITSTLTQLLEVGVMHADPHAGNLVKVITEDGTPMLGYLDFGMVSTVDDSVRDALVCAVAQLVFCRNVEAVAERFVGLQLLPESVMQDPAKKAALVLSLEKLLDEALVFPEASKGTAVPTLRFDSVLGGLSMLVAKFEFQLPPYFINNARALATLEGTYRRLYPEFNSMTAVYPFALNRLFNNPSGSEIVEEMLMDLVRDPETGLVTFHRLDQLLSDSALLSDKSKSRVLRDIMRTRGGRNMMRKIVTRMMLDRVRFNRRRKGPRKPRRKSRYFKL